MLQRIYSTMAHDFPQPATSRRNGARHRIMTEDLNTIIDADLPWTQFDGATVLVSGASGFIGSHLVETLLHRNDVVGAARTTVIALARNLERAAARFAVHSGRHDLVIELTVERDFLDSALGRFPGPSGRR
jgi:NADPH:quinone reductase-like Zn-dependent oxidoreductase